MNQDGELPKLQSLAGLYDQRLAEIHRFIAVSSLIDAVDVGNVSAAQEVTPIGKKRYGYGEVFRAVLDRMWLGAALPGGRDLWFVNDAPLDMFSEGYHDDPDYDYLEDPLVTNQPGENWKLYRGSGSAAESVAISIEYDERQRDYEAMASRPFFSFASNLVTQPIDPSFWSDIAITMGVGRAAKGVRGFLDVAKARREAQSRFKALPAVGRDTRGRFTSVRPGEPIQYAPRGARGRFLPGIGRQGFTIPSRPLLPGRQQVKAGYGGVAAGYLDAPGGQAAKLYPVLGKGQRPPSKLRAAVGIGTVTTANEILNEYLVTSTVDPLRQKDESYTNVILAGLFGSVFGAAAAGLQQRQMARLGKEIQKRHVTNKVVEEFLREQAAGQVGEGGPDLSDAGRFKLMQAIVRRNHPDMLDAEVSVVARNTIKLVSPYVKAMDSRHVAERLLAYIVSDISLPIKNVPDQLVGQDVTTLSQLWRGRGKNLSEKMRKLTRGIGLERGTRDRELTWLIANGGKYGDAVRGLSPEQARSLEEAAALFIKFSDDIDRLMISGGATERLLNRTRIFDKGYFRKSWLSKKIDADRDGFAAGLQAYAAKEGRELSQEDALFITAKLADEGTLRGNISLAQIGERGRNIEQSVALPIDFQWEFNGRTLTTMDFIHTSPDKMIEDLTNRLIPRLELARRLRTAHMDILESAVDKSNALWEKVSKAEINAEVAQELVAEIEALRRTVRDGDILNALDVVADEKLAKLTKDYEAGIADRERLSSAVAKVGRLIGRLKKEKADADSLVRNHKAVTAKANETKLTKSLNSQIDQDVEAIVMRTAEGRRVTRLEAEIKTNKRKIKEQEGLVKKSDADLRTIDSQVARLQRSEESIENKLEFVRSRIGEDQYRKLMTASDDELAGMVEEGVVPVQAAMAARGEKGLDPEFLRGIQIPMLPRDIAALQARLRKAEADVTRVNAIIARARADQKSAANTIRKLSKRTLDVYVRRPFSMAGDKKALRAPPFRKRKQLDEAMKLKRSADEVLARHLDELKILNRRIKRLTTGKKESLANPFHSGVGVKGLRRLSVSSQATAGNLAIVRIKRAKARSVAARRKLNLRKKKQAQDRAREALKEAKKALRKIPRKPIRTKYVTDLLAGRQSLVGKAARVLQRMIATEKKKMGINGGKFTRLRRQIRAHRLTQAAFAAAKKEGQHLGRRLGGLRAESSKLKASLRSTYEAMRASEAAGIAKSRGGRSKIPFTKMRRKLPSDETKLKEVLLSELDDVAGALVQARRAAFRDAEDVKLLRNQLFRDGANEATATRFDQTVLKVKGMQLITASPSHHVASATSALRGLTAVTGLGMVMISQVGDFVAKLLVHGLSAWTSGIAKAIAHPIQLFLSRSSEEEAIRFIAAAETMQGGSSVEILQGFGGMIDNGVGALGAAGRYAAWGTRKLLLADWMNARTKALSAHMAMDELLAAIESGSIDKSLRVKLHAYGLSDETIEVIGEQYRKHGEGKRGRTGMRYARADRWDDTPEAQRAREQFNGFLTRIGRSAVVSPGAMDLGAWFSDPVASLFLQFKSFSVSAATRLAYASRRVAIAQGNRHALAWHVNAIFGSYTVGYMILTAKNYLSGRPDDEITVLDAMEAGGVLGLASDLALLGGHLVGFESAHSDRVARGATLIPSMRTGLSLLRTVDAAKDWAIDGEPWTAADVNTVQKITPGMTAWWAKCIMEVFLDPAIHGDGPAGERTLLQNWSMYGPLRLEESER